MGLKVYTKISGANLMLIYNNLTHWEKFFRWNW